MSSTTHVSLRTTRGGWRRIAAFSGALAVSASAILAFGVAQALPPGGASTETPGTSGTASPSSLKPGERLSFSISGFPAGEVVSVKIDDGEFCSAKGQHGACVVHQQKVAKNGTARGSFALPSDVKPGAHWLRFLASAEMLDDDGNYLGVKPYSLRGDTDFTVVAAAAQTPGGSGGSGGSGATGSTPKSSGSQGEAPAGKGGTKTPAESGRTAGPGSAAPAPAGAASTSPTPGTTLGSTAPTTAPTPGASASAGTDPAAPDAVPATGDDATEAQPVALRVPALPDDEVAQSAPVEEDAVPWIGASILAGCVLLCSGLIAALRFGRRS